MRTISLRLASLLSASCVTQGTYDMLKGERDGLEEQLSERNKSLEAANKKITEQDDQRAKLEANLADLTQQKADLETRLTKSLGELANRTKDASKLKADVDQ